MRCGGGMNGRGGGESRLTSRLSAAGMGAFLGSLGRVEG